ncbi:NifB/NifX family molybdenum-iron cluster-binding protein [Oceanobacter antarcticus]|uniref:NifB/NifX family molybdenum-iron cluster-binding protein n=1 Tax=Oceanobacter antarcticus TaxID=3133425 RepID=A0ABW8NJ21_9GAMM
MSESGLQLLHTSHKGWRVAVASKDGVSINQHFGHAQTFVVYQLTADNIESLEQREVSLYCHGHSADHAAMADILTTIQDCDAVLVARVGDGPADKLRAIGVEPVDDYAYLGIEESLQAYRDLCLQQNQEGHHGHAR